MDYWKKGERNYIFAPLSFIDGRSTYITFMLLSGCNEVNQDLLFLRDTRMCLLNGVVRKELLLMLFLLLIEIAYFADCRKRR